MSISNDNRIAGPFTGTGAIVPYAFTFKVFATSDVVATVTDLAGAESDWVETTNYAVVLNPDQEVSPGGTLTPVAGLTTGYKLTLTSAVANLQPVVLTNAGAFLPTVINTALDRATILIQQLAAKLAYSITFPYSDGAVNGRLPTKALRANTTLGFDSNGDMIVGAASTTSIAAAMIPVVQASTLANGLTAFGFSAYIQTLIGAANAAAARTTLGAGVGDMTKAAYDAANINQQVVGTTASQTLTNKTLSTGCIAATQSANDNSTKVATTAYADAAAAAVTSPIKAWVNFNGTGTVAIRASFNVSSITDNGVGDYTVNFTSSLSDANYVVLGTVGDHPSSNSPRVLMVGNAAAPTTSACRVVTTVAGSGAEDQSRVCVSFLR